MGIYIEQEQSINFEENIKESLHSEYILNINGPLALAYVSIMIFCPELAPVFEEALLVAT